MPCIRPLIVIIILSHEGSVCNIGSSSLFFGKNSGHVKTRDEMQSTLCLLFLLERHFFHGLGHLINFGFQLPDFPLKVTNFPRTSLFCCFRSLFNPGCYLFFLLLYFSQTLFIYQDTLTFITIARAAKFNHYRMLHTCFFYTTSEF